MSEKTGRTHKISKTRSGKAKVTLYENGIPVLSKPVKDNVAALALAIAWGASL